MKHLYFIRHGLSEHNVLFKNFGKRIFYDKRYYDTKLVGQGIEESLQLGKTWDKINNIDIVFCSSLSRTIQTAINIFQDTNTKIYALDIIKEFPQGLHTCNKRSDLSLLKKTYPRVDFSLIDQENDTMWSDTKEEDIQLLNKRIHDFKIFLNKREETNIAIVGHNSFMGQMLFQKLSLVENGDKELKHCFPYEYKI
jgi:broad specificity phosphatase PhoE